MQLPSMRVRALLLAVIAIALASAWHLATHRTRRAIREIQALNGLAGTAHDIDTGIPGLRLQFGPLDSVYLLGPLTDDRKLEVLEGIPRLRDLTLANTRVTDEGLSRLARFPELACLHVTNIDYSKVIGPAGTRLATTPLAGGKGLGALKGLPSLRVVHLRGPGTSDDDLEGLGSLKQLETLNLMDTRVTEEGVARLKKALPNCSIRLR